MRFNVLTVSGSLRAASGNTGLIRMAQRVAPDGLSISDPYPINELPFYNAELDTPETEPSAVTSWRDACRRADALLIASPEYTWGPPAVLKNAIDWATRPMGAHSLVGTTTTVMSCAGKGGGAKLQEYLTTIFGLLCGPVVSEPTIAIPLGSALVSPAGSTTDPAVEEAVALRLANLLTALRQRSEAED